MAIEEGLVSFLRTVSAVTGKLAGGAAGVSIGTVDQSQKVPCVVIGMQSINNMNTLGLRGTMRQASVDFDCVATSKVVANQIADAVEAALDPYVGAAGSHTIEAVILEDRGADVVPVKQGSNVMWYVTTVVADVQFS